MSIFRSKRYKYPIAVMLAGAIIGIAGYAYLLARFCIENCPDDPTTVITASIAAKLLYGGPFVIIVGLYWAAWRSQRRVVALAVISTLVVVGVGYHSYNQHKQNVLEQNSILCINNSSAQDSSKCP
jgi:NADH:ubiquinone oxidoreductase subunit 4 (subunit M)